MQSPELRRHRRLIIRAKTALDDIAQLQTRISYLKSQDVNHAAEQREYEACCDIYKDSLRDIVSDLFTIPNFPFNYAP